MLGSLLGLEDDPISLFIGLVIGALSFFFIVAGLNYLVLFKWGKKTFQPEYVPDWKENRNAMKWAAINLVGNAALTAPIHWAMANGYSKVYWDFSDYPWWWAPLSIVCMLIVTETLIYWAHRWLHTNAGWKLHKTHHKFKEVTPWVGTAFHPIDAFLQAVPHHLCAFIFPVHGLIYLASVSIVTVWSVSIHDRTSIVKWKGLNYCGHHTLHHWYDDYNYGQYFTAWDRLCGTYKDPDTVYDEVPTRVHRPPRWWMQKPLAESMPSAPVPSNARSNAPEHAA